MSVWSSDEFSIGIRQGTFEEGIVFRQDLGAGRSEEECFADAMGFFNHVARIAAVLGISPSWREAVKSISFKGRVSDSDIVSAEVLLPITDGMRMQFGGGIRGSRQTLVTFESRFGKATVSKHQISFSDDLPVDFINNLIILGFKEIGS